ncbi:MAG: Flp family type IVb pilin [Firmicutes bacterium]|nr:Flp family type IVb pilin [Bacillota bacterium]
MLQTVWFYLQTRFNKNDEGQGMVEYGLILALVSIAAIAILYALGGDLGDILQKVSNALTNPEGLGS